MAKYFDYQCWIIREHINQYTSYAEVDIALYSPGFHLGRVLSAMHNNKEIDSIQTNAYLIQRIEIWLIDLFLFFSFFCVCRSMKINILSVICLVHTKFKESSGDLILIIVKPISNLLKMHYLLCMSFMLGNFGTNSCEKKYSETFHLNWSEW